MSKTGFNGKPTRNPRDAFYDINPNTERGQQLIFGYVRDENISLSLEELDHIVSTAIPQNEYGLKVLTELAENGYALLLHAEALIAIIEYIIGPVIAGENYGLDPNTRHGALVIKDFVTKARLSDHQLKTLVQECNPLNPQGWKTFRALDDCGLLSNDLYALLAQEHGFIYGGRIPGIGLLWGALDPTDPRSGLTIHTVHHAFEGKDPCGKIRKILTNDPPFLTGSTRNIPSFKFEDYRVEVESALEKIEAMQSALCERYNDINTHPHSKQRGTPFERAVDLVRSAGITWSIQPKVMAR